MFKTVSVKKEGNSVLTQIAHSGWGSTENIHKIYQPPLGSRFRTEYLWMTVAYIS